MTVAGRADFRPGDSPVVAFIKDATSVRIVFVENHAKPVQPQELDAGAKRQLIAILGSPDSYVTFSDLNFTTGAPAVGFEFQKNDRKVVLYCTDQLSYFWTTKQGHPDFLGILTEKARHRLATWHQKFAQQYHLTSR